MGSGDIECGATDSTFQELAVLKQEGYVEGFIEALKFLPSKVQSLHIQQYLSYLWVSCNQKLSIGCKLFNPKQKFKPCTLHAI